MIENAHTALEFVRSNPQLFVGPTGEPDLRNLAGDLAVDAIVLGCPSVTIEHFNEWFIVAAEEDWITRNTKLSLRECFNRIQRFPEHRRNSTRTAVVVAAFAENVLVHGKEGQTIIKGCGSGLEPLAAHLASRFQGWRVVAFSVLLSPERTAPPKVA